MCLRMLIVDCVNSRVVKRFWLCVVKHFGPFTLTALFSPLHLYIIHARSRYTMHRNQREKEKNKQTKTISMIWQIMSLACAHARINDPANEQINDWMNEVCVCARAFIHCLWLEMNHYHIFYASYSPYIKLLLFLWFAFVFITLSLTHARRRFDFGLVSV